MADEPVPIVPSDTEWRRQAGRGGSSSISKPLALLVGGLMIVGLVGLIIGLLLNVGSREWPYVVTIPIDDYNDRGIAAFTAKDAERLCQTLSDSDRDKPDENTEKGWKKILTVDQVNSKLKAIRSGILLSNWTPSQKLRKDRPFLLSIAGLGDVDANGKVFWLTSDGQIAIDEILDAMAMCPSKHKLLLLDITHARAGYDGNQFEETFSESLNRSLSERSADRERGLPCHVLISSSGRGEVSEVIPQEQMSAFGYYVVQGLKGWADLWNPTRTKNSRVVVSELAEYVAVRTNRWVVENRRRTQTVKLFPPTAAGVSRSDFDLVVNAKPTPMEEKDAEGNLTPVPIQRFERLKSGLVQAWENRPAGPPSPYDEALIRAEARFRQTGEFDAGRLPKPPSAASSADGVPRALPTLHRYASKPPPPPPMPGAAAADPMMAVTTWLDDAWASKDEPTAALDAKRNLIEILPPNAVRLAIWEWLIRKNLQSTIARDRLVVVGHRAMMTLPATDDPSIEERILGDLAAFFKTHNFLTETEKTNWPAFVERVLAWTNAMTLWLGEGHEGWDAIRDDVQQLAADWIMARELTTRRDRRDFSDMTEFNVKLQQRIDDVVRLRKTLKTRRDESAQRTKAYHLAVGTARACAEFDWPREADWRALSDGSNQAVIKRIESDLRPEKVASLIAEIKTIKAITDLTSQKFTMDEIDALLATPYVSEPNRSQLTDQRNRLADLLHERTWRTDSDEDRKGLKSEPSKLTTPWDPTVTAARRKAVKSTPPVAPKAANPNDRTVFDGLLNVVSGKSGGPAP